MNKKLIKKGHDYCLIESLKGVRKAAGGQGFPPIKIAHRVYVVDVHKDGTVVCMESYKTFDRPMWEKGRQVITRKRLREVRASRLISTWADFQAKSAAIPDGRVDAIA